jgi:hypothetical protein
MTKETNFQQGTIVINAKVKYSPAGSSFNFWKYSVEENRMSLEIRNKTDLTFVHFFEGKENKVITNFSDFFNKEVQIAATWDLSSTDRSLKLYVNGGLKGESKLE